MAITGGTIAAGILPTAKGTLYTVSAGQIGHLYVTLVNANAGAKKGRIYIKRSGGTSRRVFDEPLAINGTAGCGVELPRRGNAYRLSAGDLIEGDDNGGGGADVEYTIDGGIEDIA